MSNYPDIDTNHIYNNSAEEKPGIKQTAENVLIMLVGWATFVGVLAMIFAVIWWLVSDGKTAEEKAAERAISDPVSAAKYMCHDYLRDSKRDNFLIKSSKVFPDSETNGYRVVVKGSSNGIGDHRFCRINATVDRVLQSNRL